MNELVYMCVYNVRARARVCRKRKRERLGSSDDPVVGRSVGPRVRISHLHRNKLARTMDSLVHSEHCKHAATVFPWTNGKPLQYAPLTLSTEGGSIIDPALSFVCPTIISYLVTFSGLSPAKYRIISRVQKI